jgi:transposase
MFTDEPAAAPSTPASAPVDSAEVRRKRGRIIAALSLIRPEGKDNRYRVPSQNGKQSYLVWIDSKRGPEWRCECKDFEKRGESCKHIFAVRYVIEREKTGVPPIPKPEKRPFIEQKKEALEQALPRRKTYKQDWPAYDAAQVFEKARFQELLVELCRGIPSPPANPKGGRPPLPMSDRAFACAFKVYTTISGRRASTDMREAGDKGHLAKVPHWSAVSRYLEDPAMTPILTGLIAESARPLASVEQDFAADSSGFTTCRFESWYDHKYGVVRREHGWVKVHIMCGVNTNVVTAVEVRGRDQSDISMLPPLVTATASRFAMREVSADRIYASYDNLAEIAKNGATPYIPFKSNHSGSGKGATELWSKMYHFYSFNRDEFLSHYHKRINTESCFSMIKSKFGDYVRSKTDAAMVNEALCKVLCHNVCCLIQSACELGIEARFWRDEAEPAAKEETDIEAAAWDWI